MNILKHNLGKRTLCVLAAATMISSISAIPASINTNSMNSSPIAIAQAATTTNSTSKYYTISYYASNSYGNTSSVKEYITFKKSNAKIVSVTYNGNQVVKPNTSESTKNSQILYADFNNNTSVDLYAQDENNRMIDVVVKYSDNTTEKAVINVTKSYISSNKTINLKENTSSTVTLSRKNKQIKSIYTNSVINNNFIYTYKHYNNSKDKTSNKYDYIELKAKSNAKLDNYYISVLYWDNTVELYQVKINRVNVTLRCKEYTLNSYISYGNGFNLSSIDSKTGKNRTIESCNCNTSLISYSINKKTNIIYINVKPNRAYNITTMNIIYRDSNGYKVIQPVKITIINNRELNNTIGYYTTVNTPYNIKSISVNSGNGHATIKKINNTQYTVTYNSGDNYSLNRATTKATIYYTNGGYEKLTVNTSWPEYSTNPKSKNRWSYDNFINSGIVHWGGKQFSWYTMLATNKNCAGGIAWPLPITNNPGNLLAYLPQSDWDRLTKMQKTNPKATMQDAFKPWSSDSKYWVDEGFIRDNQGYIAIAAPLNLLNNGTVKRMQVIATPWGPARIYDACPEGSWDIYVRSHCFSGFTNMKIVKAK